MLIALIRRSAYLLATCAVIGLARPAPANARSSGIAGGADQSGAEAAVAWFDLLASIIRTGPLSPPVASRVAGYAGVALFEAVAPGVAGRPTLAGKLGGFAPATRPPRGRSLHWPTAANTALAATLRGLLAGLSAPTVASIDALERSVDALSRPVPSSHVKAESIAYGRRVAEAVLAWAAADGFAKLAGCPYTPPVGPGLWVPTPPDFAPPVQPCWGGLRPFALSSAEQCAPPPPPPYSTDPASPFYAEADEVYRISLELTPEQRAIALFWAGDPTAHSIGLVGRLAADRDLSLGRAARVYAAVGIASADAFISTWAAKYEFNLQRPITYIRLFHPGWLPLLPTPPFPECTSGHSVQSAAAARVLTALLGPMAYEDDTQPALPPRGFPSFEAAAAEDGLSRIYGGIHFRTAVESGARQGECIGSAVLAAF